MEMVDSILKLIAFLVFWSITGIFLIPTFLKKTKQWLNGETFISRIYSDLCLGTGPLATRKSRVLLRTRGFRHGVRPWRKNASKPRTSNTSLNPWGVFWACLFRLGRGDDRSRHALSRLVPELTDDCGRYGRTNHVCRIRNSLVRTKPPNCHPIGILVSTDW